MSLQLAEAQTSRRQRGDDAVAAYVDRLLDHVGLSEVEIAEHRAHLGTENVSPGDRQKLKGIIARLRKNPHPFSQCMKDLRKHQPGWSEDRRKKTCAVLKQLTGRGKSGSKSSNMAGVVVSLDAPMISLLDMVDTEVLAIMEAQPEGEEFATLTAKKRKSLPKGSFVFPSQKRYPIHDRAHAINALARAKGKPEEATVRRAVCAKFKDLPACGQKKES